MSGFIEKRLTQDTKDNTATIVKHRLCEIHMDTLKTRYQTRSSRSNILSIRKTKPYDCTWQITNNTKDWLQLHLLDIVDIAKFDLGHTYTTGRNILNK